MSAGNAEPLLDGHNAHVVQDPIGDEISKVGETVRGPANFTSITVQGYQTPIHVEGNGYPEILRTDRETTISLHPDDVATFLAIREKIGRAIYLEDTFIFIHPSEMKISERLIRILDEQGIRVSPPIGTYNITW